MNKTNGSHNTDAPATIVPRIYGPVADSWSIARGVTPNVEWLTPDREWQGSIFEAARFELDEREKAERWLQREIDAIDIQ